WGGPFGGRAGCGKRHGQVQGIIRREYLRVRLAAGLRDAPLRRQMTPYRPEVPMRLSLSLCLALATPACANDGFGGLCATAVTFGQTDAVVVQDERLLIRIDRISVDYVCRNLTDEVVTGEVIFPLPPVGVWSGYEAMINLPEDLTNADLVDFTATVH